MERERESNKKLGEVWLLCSCWFAFCHCFQLLCLDQIQPLRRHHRTSSLAPCHEMRICGLAMSTLVGPLGSLGLIAGPVGVVSIRYQQHMIITYYNIL